MARQGMDVEVVEAVDAGETAGRSGNTGLLDTVLVVTLAVVATRFGTAS